MIQQSRAPFGLLDLTRAGQQRVKVAIFLDQQCCGLEPDAGRAGHVVDAVPGQALHIDHTGRINAKLFKHLVRADGLVLHRIEHVDAGADQLHQILVG